MSYERYIEAEARLHGFIGTRSADLMVRRRQAELFGTPLAKDDQPPRGLLGPAKTPPPEERFAEAYSKAVYALKRGPKMPPGTDSAALADLFVRSVRAARTARQQAGKKAEGRYAPTIWRRLEAELAAREEAQKMLAAVERLRGVERARAAADAPGTKAEKAQRFATFKAEVRAIAADKEVAGRLASGTEAAAWKAVTKAAGKWRFGGLPSFAVSTSYHRGIGTLIILGVIGGLVALALRFDAVGRWLAIKAPIDGWLRATYLSWMGGDVERVTMLAAAAHLAVFASWMVLVPLGVWRVSRARVFQDALGRAIAVIGLVIGPYFVVVTLFNVGIGR